MGKNLNILNETKKYGKKQKETIFVETCFVHYLDEFPVFCLGPRILVCQPLNKELTLARHGCFYLNMTQSNPMVIMMGRQIEPHTLKHFFFFFYHIKKEIG